LRNEWTIGRVATHGASFPPTLTKTARVVTGIIEIKGRVLKFPGAQIQRESKAEAWVPTFRIQER
jgi:hypothetical protein